MNELVELLDDYKRTVDDKNNHWVRRFFRCWLDGSYLGEDHYKGNQSHIRILKDTPELSEWVLNEFYRFLRHEFDGYTPYRIISAVNCVFSGEEKQKLTQDLVVDALDLIDM